MRVKAFSRFLRDELSYSRDFVSDFLYGFGNDGQVFAFDVFQRFFHNAGTAYTYVYGTIVFAYAVERARHKRIIFYRVCEHHEFCTAYAVVFPC